MNIGIYSVTYRGVWYRGEALDVFSLMRLAKQQGWENVELDAERPHAAPMDFSADGRAKLRGLSQELALPISAISPNCDFSSPVPVQREAMICYVRECIKLARDVGAPLCKLFAAWRGITVHDGLGTYDEVRGYEQYGYWKGERRGFVVGCLRELAKVAEDCGVVLAMQNHGPDIIKNYKDVLSLIADVGSPALKACMDISLEPKCESAAHARAMVKATGSLLVHSHFNGEFRRAKDDSVELGYPDGRPWPKKVVYPEYVAALMGSGYTGCMNWEFCHPALDKKKKRLGIEYVHSQTELALEYMRALRAKAQGRG